MFKQSLALRVLGICILVLALPLLISTFIFFNRAYDDLIERANKTLEEASLYRTLSLEEMTPIGLTFLKELKYLSKLDHEISNLPNKAFNQKLIDLTKNIKEFDVYVMDSGRDGHYQVIASNKEDSIGSGFDSFTRLKTVEEKEKGNFIRYHYSKELKKAIPYLYSALAIYDPMTHKLQGFLTIADSILNEQTQLLQNYQENNQQIYFAVIDVSGFVQAATDSAFEGQHFDDIPKERQNQLIAESDRTGLNFFAEKTLPIIKNKDNPNLFEFKWNGEMQLAALTPYRDSGIAVMAYSPKKQVFAQALNRFLAIYIVFGLIVLLGGTFIYFLTRWLSRPLDQLLKLMRKVRSGNLNLRYKPEKLGFELNFLGEVFNETINTLVSNMHLAERETIKKETVQKELNVARSVQKGLLPKKTPQIQGIELAAHSFITKEVGGGFL